MWQHNQKESSSFLKLKRNIYLVIIPILIMALTIAWLFTTFANERIVYPPLALILAIFWILLFQNRYIRASEITILGILGLFHTVRVFILMENLAYGIFDLYMLWSPLFFIFIFMILTEKKALSFALIIFAVMTFIGGFHLHHNDRVTVTIIQFLISHIIYIILLHYVKRLVSDYVESDLLKKIAYQDTLTGIANRRMLERWLESEVQFSNETQSIFSIIYFDVDHFKTINDTYGHEIGDGILKELALIVKSRLDERDYFGRWGGEEFLVLATNQSDHEAKRLAEGLRSVIEKHAFLEVGRVTASFGVSSFSNNDQPRTLLQRADLALYEAKNSGRNKVVVHKA
jgi:diguanylate cyclase (GGDEF)-like protein